MYTPLQAYYLHIFSHICTQIEVKSGKERKVSFFQINLSREGCGMTWSTFIRLQKCWKQPRPGVIELIVQCVLVY